MLGKEDLLCNRLDINEIDGYSIIDIYSESYNDNLLEKYMGKDMSSNKNCEDCTVCYHSDGEHCFIHNIKICKLTPICWSYRDCFSMRASRDFQGDNDTY